MKRIALLLHFFALTAPGAFAQEQQAPPPAAGTIEAIEVSGIPEERLSQTLRDELQKLKGQPYDAAVAAQFADRVQAELPQHVAAVRTAPGTQDGLLRLIIVVAEMSDNDTLGENINERYPIESVTLEGIDQSAIRPDLWNDMQKMVGQPLNNDEADRLMKGLQTELGTRYIVRRRVRRGKVSRQLTLTYIVEKTPMLRWEPPHMKFAYQTKQGITAFPVIYFGGPRTIGNFRLGFGTNGDELVERFKGAFLAYEKLDLGTERLGFRILGSTYGTKWKSQTLEASQQVPGAAGVYRSRNSVQPELAFAITPDLFISAGFNATELRMQFPSEHTLSARPAIAGIHFQRDFSTERSDRRWRDLMAVYSVRSAGAALDSDFNYTRHFWNARYIYRQNSAMVKLDVRAGKITGNAPLFERFSIGNTETARGWNKYDIAPLGTDRMVHGTLEAGRHDIRLFYDAGSVWDRGQSIRVRQSIGLTFGAGESTGEGFVTLALAFRNSRLEPTIMLRLWGR